MWTFEKGCSNGNGQVRNLYHFKASLACAQIKTFAYTTVSQGSKRDSDEILEPFCQHWFDTRDDEMV